jgi:hypothetical protein
MFKRGTGRFRLVGFLGVCRVCGRAFRLRGSGKSFCLGRGKIMKRLSPEEKYLYSLRKQREALVSFAADEELNAGLLLSYYRQKGRDMPDDIYRASAFFINREYQRKPGSLFLLYRTKEKLQKEFTEITKENAADVLCYRYQMYAAMLREGGY